MILDLFYKFIIVLVPIVHIAEPIIQFRKDQYNPLIFGTEERYPLKLFILNFAFIISADNISDRFFLKTSLIILTIGLPVVINILNFKFLSIKSDRKVLCQTLIFNVMFISLFLIIIFH